MHDIMWIHMTSHPLYMISHYDVTFTYTVFMSSHPVYLLLHPLSLSYYLQFIDESTSAIFVISNHYMYDIIWILSDITTTIIDIKDSIHVITSTIFLNTDPLYTSRHTLHLWHHSHCNYDKTPAMLLTWYSVYMRSHPLNEWQHNDGFWHDTQCICVIKPTWLMTSHLCTYETTPTACMTP